jgi:hypothetical protein
VQCKKKNCKQSACFGQSVCSLHGGTTGYYQFLDEGKVREVYDQFLNDPNVFGLRQELALQKTMLASVLSRIEGGELKDISPNMVGSIMAITERITVTVERIAKIESNVPLGVHYLEFTRLLETVATLVSELDLPRQTVQTFIDRLEQLALPSERIIDAKAIG